VAPFFLNETFPPNWYPRGVPLTLPSAVAEAVGLFALNPRELGANEGLNNFVPLQTSLTSATPAQVGCFLLQNILDATPGQIAGTVIDNLEVYEGFVKGVLAPFFFVDGYFNCEFESFVAPSANAGVSDDGSVSSSGSPVNGAYPGIGVIKPDSQPS
jgi:hypothetical protein